MELILKAQDKNLESIIDFVHNAISSEYKINQEILNKIDLAVEEIFINIAHYAYGAENTDNEITINCMQKDDTLTIIFIDSGIPFNPLNRPDPDITLSAEKRSIGGLGIFLTKKFMDKVEYEYRDGCNILTIKKDLK